MSMTTQSKGETPMPLNWNVSKCEGYEEWEEVDRYNLEDVIMATMAVGISQITKANAVAFATRYYALMKAGKWSPINFAPEGEKLSRKNSDRFPESKEVYRRVHKYIGLSTNVTEFSEAEFKRRLWKNYLDKSTAMQVEANKMAEGLATA